MDDDATQLERLHREHAAAVRAYVRRRIGPEDADDVVADVFVVAWRRLADVPAEPRTWLLGVARKALGNRRRTARRQRALYDRLADEAGTGVSSVAAPGDAVVAGDGAVLRALATLSPRDREVLLLVTWDGLTHAEAAEVLGTRPGTLAMRVLRARRRLEDALDLAGAAPTPAGAPHPSPRPALRSPPRPAAPPAPSAAPRPVRVDAPHPARRPPRPDRHPTSTDLLDPGASS